MPVFTNILDGGLDQNLLGKLIGQFSSESELPSASLYPQDTLAYVVGLGFRKVQGSAWVDASDLVSGGGGGSGDMSTATYDSDEDGIVDAADEAAALDDGSNAATALQVRSHLDAQDNPHGVTAAQVGASEPGHTHDANDIDSGGATDGQVLTADGSGNTAWEDASGGGSSGLQLVEGGSDVVTGLLHQTSVPHGTDDMLYLARDGTSDRQVNVRRLVGYLEHANTIADFVDISGSTSVDLDEGHVFRMRLTGDATLSVTGSDWLDDEVAPSWTLILMVDGSGGHTFTGPTVQWIDGASWDDLDLSPNAVNVVQFFQGLPGGSSVADPFAALLWNGAVLLDPYVFSFQQNGTLKIVLTRAEELDVANASTHGDGSVTYAKNGSDITTRTTFAASDILEVTVSGQTDTTAVSIPRYAA